MKKKRENLSINILNVENAAEEKEKKRERKGCFSASQSFDSFAHIHQCTISFA